MLALLIPGLLMGGSSTVSASGWTGEWVYPVHLVEFDHQPPPTEWYYSPGVFDWSL